VRWQDLSRFSNGEFAKKCWGKSGIKGCSADRGLQNDRDGIHIGVGGMYCGYSNVMNRKYGLYNLFCSSYDVCIVFK
jgi:hypothetical protein